MATTRRTFLSASLAALGACATDSVQPRATRPSTPTLAAPDGGPWTGSKAAPPDALPRPGIKGVFVLGVDGLCMPLFRHLAGPGLRLMQKKAIDCTRVFADYPLCAPTRASVLTGLPPHEHGQIGNAFVLSEAIPTLVDHFAAEGLVCRLYGKQHSNNVEEDGSFGYATVMGREGEAFEEAAQRYADGQQTTNHPPDATLLAEIESITGLPLGGMIRPRSRDPDWINLNEAIQDAARDMAEGRPFFVNAQLLAPHHPYSCPEEYYTLYDPAEFELSSLDREGYLESAAGRSEAEDHGWAELRDEHVQLLLARLYGMHHYADDLLRHAIEELTRLGLIDEMVFVFTSDHGEMAGGKGLFLKTVFEDSATRIALMIRSPHQTVGRDYAGLMSCMDVLPTVGGVMGLAPAEGVRGRDFSASMRLGTPARAAHFAYTEMYRGYQDELPYSLGEMVRTERYKYCRFDERGFPDGEMEQLYDMVEDPEEHDNLAGRPGFEGLAAELSQLIDDRLRQYGPPLVELEKI